MSTETIIYGVGAQFAVGSHTFDFDGDGQRINRLFFDSDGLLMAEPATWRQVLPQVVISANPAAASSGTGLVSSTSYYEAAVTAADYNDGDTISNFRVFDTSTGTITVSTWRNESQGTSIPEPPQADLIEKSSGGLTNAELRAVPVIVRDAVLSGLIIERNATGNPTKIREEYANLGKYVESIITYTDLGGGNLRQTFVTTEGTL